MRLRLLLTALTGALALGLAAGTPAAPAPASEPAPAPTGAIRWTPCPKDASAECGTLRLPVDRARPSGARFDLALARRRATDPDRRIGVLLVNPGGPGASGVDFAVGDAPSYFGPEIRARFDIIGFDPRGVARSSPVTCSTEVLARQPSTYPRDQAGFDRLAAFNRAVLDDCRENSGPITDHADTLGVVHDMDAVRAALGEQRISYFGHSYGTLIGEQYAEEYGDRLRSMILTANLDHSLGLRDFMVSSAKAAEDSFHRFVAWCESTASCALHGRDVTAVWDALLARADRGLITDPENPGGRPLDAHAITLTAFRAFYGPDWSELASYMAELDAQAPKRPVPAAPAPAPAPPQGTRAEPFHAVFCQDWDFRPKDYAEFARVTEAELRAAPHMRGAPRTHDAVAGCVGRPDRVNNPQHRLRVTGAPRILMLHSRHDPANRFTWAAAVHRQTPGTTVLLPYEGDGHSVYGRNACTRGAVDDYLVRLRLPSPGSSCPPAAPAAGRRTPR
ncbi:alpha/beta fold hydrolase [Streptomyces sp. NPDC056347]|uniref:alpha/beta fold hydrolase n=1 Tax=Streptomyces sp. NPDC056347 TaxID=3345790 RepID=UPI0035DF8AF7